MAGRYSNMAAAVIASSASSLPPSHIIASSCLAVQRAKSAIAGKLGLNTADIEQVFYNVYRRTLTHGMSIYISRELPAIPGQQ